jgi:hypothetical protein
MPYFVFDLDETLGNLHTPHYFLYDLRRQTTRSPNEQTKRIATTPPPELVPYIDMAYAKFVELVAQQEQSHNPLGIIRPGMIEVFHELLRMRDLGICEGVVIYSNNGCLSNLQFARDVLHAAIGTNDLICDCIHWHHPFRQEEYIYPLREGGANKTWKVFQAILTKGACQAPIQRVVPSNCYFFDDQEHLDLETVLQGHYIHMNEYPYHASFSRVANLYLESLRFAGLTKDSRLLYDYILYCSQLYPNTRVYNPKRTLGRHIQILRQLTGTTSMVHAPPPDETVQQILELLPTIQTIPMEVLQQEGGGKAPAKRKTRKTARGKRRQSTK